MQQSDAVDLLARCLILLGKKRSVLTRDATILAHHVEAIVYPNEAPCRNVMAKRCGETYASYHYKHRRIEKALVAIIQREVDLLPGPGTREEKLAELFGSLVRTT
jgi:hypothetical protein